MIDLIIMLVFGWLYVVALKMAYNKYICKFKYKKLILIGILILTIIIAHIIDVVFSTNLIERFRVFFVIAPLCFVEDIIPVKNNK